jgi:hypothetical protein
MQVITGTLTTSRTPMGQPYLSTTSISEALLAMTAVHNSPPSSKRVPTVMTEALGAELGPVLGAALGPHELGLLLVVALVVTIGAALGDALDPALGKELGLALEKELRPTFGIELGPAYGEQSKASHLVHDLAMSSSAAWQQAGNAAAWSGVWSWVHGGPWEKAWA